MINEKTVFIFIGRSGCGKGTQGALLMEKIKKMGGRDVYYLESGENFRQFIQKPAYSSELSKKIYESGALQPEFLSVWVWSHLMVDNLKGEEHLFLDGTPRKLREAKVLETAFDFYGYKNIYVVYVDISREESKKRLLARGRSDDKDPKEVDKRLDWFDTDVIPTIEFFQNSPRYRFIRVSGEQPIEGTHGDIVKALGI